MTAPQETPAVRSFIFGFYIFEKIVVAVAEEWNKQVLVIDPKSIRHF